MSSTASTTKDAARPASPSPPPPPPPSHTLHRSVSPRVLPEERPQVGMVSTRAKEILESMRQQRESFLASLQPTEGETAARKMLEKNQNGNLSSAGAAPSSVPPKPPLFTSSEAQALTRRLHDSINQRKERLARFSNETRNSNNSTNSIGSRGTSPSIESKSFVSRMTQSPHSLATTSTAESSSFYSSPNGSSSGYDSDGSPATVAIQQQYTQFELAMPRHPNLEGILEKSIETDSETGSDISSSGGRNTTSFHNTSLLSTTVSADVGEDSNSTEVEKTSTSGKNDSEGAEKEGAEEHDDSVQSPEELEVQVHTDLSDSDSELDDEAVTNRRIGAPMMTLFGYTSFDERVTRPPLLVHCKSYSSQIESSSDDNSVHSPTRMRRLSRSNSAASGLSNFSSPGKGPLGHTVEQRKKALLKTLSTTVAELERMKIDISAELSSVITSDTAVAIKHPIFPTKKQALELKTKSSVKPAASSSYTSIGISSASSFTYTADGSETSGWISPGSSIRSFRPHSAKPGKQEKVTVKQAEPEKAPAKSTEPEKEIFEEDSNSLVKTKSDKQDARQDIGEFQEETCPPDSLQKEAMEPACPPPSPLSSRKTSQNALGDLADDSDAEPKLLGSPATSSSEKENSKVRKNSPDKRKTVRICSPSRKSLSPVKKTKIRLPGAKELAAICFPRGNLWNIAKSSGMKYRGPIMVNRNSVYRTDDYIRYASESKCGTRGGLYNLALGSGMKRPQALSPQHKLKPPRTKAQQRWKLKARGGHYHLTVWTNFTNNMLSPSSIFRDPRPKHRSAITNAEYEKARLLARSTRRSVGPSGFGSFHYVTNETRKECI